MANFFKYSIITLFIFTCTILFSKNASAGVPPASIGIAHIIDGTGSISLLDGNVFDNEKAALVAALNSGIIPADGTVCLAIVQLGADGGDADNESYAQVELPLVQVTGGNLNNIIRVKC